MPGKQLLISVITPCFNEQENVRLCYEAVRRVFSEHLKEYVLEHIFTDNASTDRTVDILREIAREEPSVRIIVNSRNFGALPSLFNAIKRARGDAVVLMLPADLQDPPNLIPRFIEQWRKGYNIVYGVRKHRDESHLLKFFRGLFYRTIDRYSDFPIPHGAGEFQLVDRKVVDAISSFGDYYPFVRGMVAYTGFSATGVEYAWLPRIQGKSKNSFFQLVDQAMGGILAFSQAPLRVLLGLGFIISLVALLYSVIVFVLSLTYYRYLSPPGIPTLIAATFFFAGVQLFLLGVVGEYLCAIFNQTRGRPSVIEKELINFGDNLTDGGKGNKKGNDDIFRQ